MIPVEAMFRVRLGGGCGIKQGLSGGVSRRAVPALWGRREFVWLGWRLSLLEPFLCGLSLSSMGLPLSRELP